MSQSGYQGDSDGGYSINYDDGSNEPVSLIIKLENIWVYN
jgi:hypothetical protein